MSDFAQTGKMLFLLSEKEPVGALFKARTVRGINSAPTGALFFDWKNGSILTF